MSARSSVLPQCFVGIFLFAASTLLSSLAQSQENCGELTEFQCSLLARSVRTWNERYGSEVRIDDWSYETALTADNRAEVLDSLTNPERVWLPDQDPEGKLRGVKSLSSIEDEEAVKLIESQWKNDVEAFLRSADHLVELNWTIQSDKFTTLPMISDQYPFIYDSMLSNVLLLDKMNTCEHTLVKWLWGGVRGEIIVDIEPLWERDVKHCRRLVRGWMQFGTLQHKVGELVRHGSVCRFEYAYVFTSPSVLATFSRAGFDVEISGVGSYKIGGGDCVDSSPGD